MVEAGESALIAIAKQGNKAAFSQLVVRYQSMALRLATRSVSDPDLAQELVQEAFLQAYLSLDKLNDSARFKSWLYGIVLNVCRSHLRRRKVILLSLETNLQDAIADHSPDPQSVVEQEELQTAVLEAVDTLSPKNRSAILLFYHEQLSLQEVANRLSISVNAVKGRLHKSRHQLRERLSPLQEQIQPTLTQEIQIMTTNPQTEPEFSCSFCNKSSAKVETLIAGPGVFICNECVAICNQILSGSLPPLTQEQIETLMEFDSSKD